MNAIRPDAIRAHVRFLSGSLLQGRARQTAGYEIRHAMSRLNLKLRAFIQQAGTGPGNKPCRCKAGLDDSKSSVVLVTQSGEHRSASLKLYVLFGDLKRTDTSVKAPVVFVGSGVRSLAARPGYFEARFSFVVLIPYSSQPDSM